MPALGRGKNAWFNIMTSMSLIREARKRITLLWELSTVYAHAVRRGSARGSCTEPRTILVVQGAKLGDMVCTTPMFRALKSRYPTSRLIVAGDKINKALLEHHPNVDEYLILQDSASGMARTYLAHNIDIAFVLNPSFNHSAACFLGNIRSIVVPRIRGGVCPFETTTFRMIRPLMHTFFRSFGAYAPQEFLAALEHVGIHSTDTTKTLRCSESAQATVRSLLAPYAHHTLICMSVSSGNKIKKWPEERFAAVIEHIVARPQTTVVIIGSKVDTQQVNTTLSLLTHPERVLNTCEQLNLDELKALISEMDMFVSVDTGPLYIAEAYAIPTIDIVGPMDEHEQPPRGLRHVVIVGKRDAPATHLLNARPTDIAAARAQTEAIDVTMVTNAYDELLAPLTQ